MKNITKYVLFSCIVPLMFMSCVQAELFPTGQALLSETQSLRATITPERIWWDLQHYHLAIEVDPKKKSLTGVNTMKYKVLSEHNVLQIDLQAPMKLTRVEQQEQPLIVKQRGDSYFVHLTASQTVGDELSIKFFFSGQPQAANQPPWDGGLVWQQDDQGLDFIASACQGVGASIWWPNKEHSYDEPDQGALLSIEVPEHLTDVSNGRLLKVDHNQKKATKTYHWQVTYPINNYGININIADYVHFSEEYLGEQGPLTMDYYVLRQDEQKARKHFVEAKRTLAALEHWFGPYPFYRDGFKLVQAPYLGMEHQSSVTYGNGFKNGYLGTDRSATGVGMLFDFIIIHESAHEWFANSITHQDIADLWIHEAFASYAESLFLEYHFGQALAYEYLIGTRITVKHDRPIIGVYDRHQEGSGDMYSKGSNMLHMIRQLLDDDKKWLALLRGINKQFYLQNIDSKAMEDYITQQTGLALSKVFDQYLRDARLPILEYFIKGERLKIRWSNVIADFTMPVKVKLNGQTHWLTPTTHWQDIDLAEADAKLEVDANFFVGTLNILGQ